MSAEQKFNLTWGGAGHFQTTRWSIVLAAGESASQESSAALEKLCRDYWFPLYVFVRRQGHQPEEAQDLTQEFFARLLEGRSFRSADPRKGKFRSFLLGALKHFLANEWKRGQRLKRGGHCVVLSLDELDAEGRYQIHAADPLTPETAYERRWAEAVLEQAMNSLSEEHARAGKAERFAALKVYLLAGQEPVSYAQTAAQLGLSEGAVKWTIHQLRQRYGELVRAEIAQTVAHPDEVDQELRHLLAVLSG